MEIFPLHSVVIVIQQIDTNKHLFKVYGREASLYAESHYLSRKSLPTRLFASELKDPKLLQTTKTPLMAFQQYFVQEWRPENISACFDCSICLDFARDPVVTLCGHLYCWPCIYKWFDSQSVSLAPNELPQCPVCKAEISEKTMIPLYGRGQSFSKPEQEADTIPPRPSASGIQHIPSHNLHQNLQNMPNTSSTVHSQTVGMFGEMVYARVFGNSQSLYTYPNSYHSVGGSSARLRRQETQTDKSLNRVTIFLFCCILSCLLLF